ncbi:hypothetical protein MLD38_032983 [Melastoma candidum]|uniref:Uncharacterized protein n=1 Tax=Melastoma candidum TaxID=119954 RepID=A0ACB9M7D9_9MYRT|nr:hypothetical protein MLD38_032983 [Melastoma candidum]
MDAVAHHSRLFLGVRFVLVGFRDDDDFHRNVAEKLVRGGGVDVGRYGMDCTHVIVEGLVYDDPVCVTARKDGKTLVTALWVEHSCDIGMAVDPKSIMYRPLKDMKGIPGAAGLIVCLTGYQRQDRDDIMTMVRLMGAQFSKPLVATKVTHLICYKFEGEKYDLAKKMKKIKLVNHQWLEDCLREWELLPESNYSRSGYELETEAEAKDSEEEEEDKFLKPCQENVTKKSPILKLGISCSSMSPVLKEQLVVSPPKGITITDDEVPAKLPEGMQPTLGNAGTPQSDAKFSTLSYSRRTSSMSVSPPGKDESGNSKRNLLEELPSTSRNAGSPQPDAKFSTLSYSRKTSSMSVSPPGEDESGNSKKNIQEELPTTSRNAGTPHLDAKFSTQSYSWRTSGMLVSPPGKDESGNADFMKVNFSLSTENVMNNSLMETLDKVTSGSYDVQTPSKTTKVCNAESKDKSVMEAETEVSSAGCKLVKKYSSPSVGSKSEESKASVLMDKQSSGSSVMLNEMTSLHCTGLEKTHVSASDPRISSTGLRKIAYDLPATEIMGVGSVVDKDDSKVTSHTSPRMLPNSISGLKHTIQGMDTEQADYHSQEKPVQPELTDCLSLRDQEAGIIAAFDAAKVNLAKGEKNITDGSTERKTTPPKKTLGRKRNVPAFANVKGSIYLTKGNMESENRSSCDLQPEIDIVDKSSNADRTEMPGHKGSALVTEEANDTTVCREVHELISHEMDDETEAPEEIGEPTENEYEKVNSTEKPDICVEKMSEVADKAFLRCFPSDKVGDLPKKIAAENPSNDQLLGGPKQFSKNLKNVKGSKRPLSTRNLKGTRIEDDGSLDISSSRVVKQKIDKQQNDYKSSIQVEKENQPLENKSGRKKRSIKRECGEGNASMKMAVASCVNKTEPARFIMSGERQQRMQLRKAIQGLKGKLCMDSHRWSYQATHFICAKPVRTEKWFVACASGRWILRPEYVYASSQEGKFLDEEPYEWHKTGLSQDGAINLEAPRKWRLLRQRTGHGALYDMRIIVYGECIAPPLETLKRAMKAGDGTILATSPPYTRFLNAKTDFAVISPGMPRVDAWIQEFLKHEIPCVVADYLVEYVCKPGYSLDKHVLYNTHSWAERSFSRLQGKAEEVLGIVVTPNNEDSSDTRCNVCCLSDREEAMLICGDEARSVGCGSAAHIDCCNPPLEAVPKEDWLCPKCSIQGTKNTISTTTHSKRKRRSR